MDELLNSSLVTIADTIACGKVKSKEVVIAFLDRIERVNKELNAVVLSTAEQALKHADKADADLKNGNSNGTMHGVPITIKDSLDTIDAITTWGTLGRKEFKPGRNATCVERLRNQGAILMVDVLGVSLLSGAHMGIIPEILKLLKEAGADDIRVVAGGVIPDDDAEALKNQGVAEVLFQDSAPDEIVSIIRQVAAGRGTG